MKSQLTLLFILSLLVSSCSPFVISESSGEPPTPEIQFQLATQDQAESLDRAEYEGVSFALDPTLAASASAQTIAENPSSTNGPYWGIHPRYIRFSLVDYSIAQASFEPVISVYPVEGYRRLSPRAGELLDQLTDFLVQKPVVADQVPSLPLTNAGQIFSSNLQYLEFKNGSGVRFLTIYSQAAGPVTNQDLVYVFQGLTADGRHAVSILLPVNHSSLPVDPDALSPGERDEIYQDYGKYRIDMANILSAQPAGSFTPNLEQLDALAASIQIED